MADPFQRRRSGRGGLRARLFGRPSRASFVRELENLLGSARHLREVPARSVEELAARHGVDLSRSMRPARRSLYQRFLEHCLEDHALSAAESEDLAHLRGLLELDDADAAALHDEVSRRVYGEAIDRVLQDHRLDPEEQEFLRGLGAQLRIPDAVAGDLYAEGARRARERYLSATVARDSVLFAPREAVLQLAGTSETSIEDAVRAALEEARHAVPDLCWLELAEVRAEVEEGRLRRWRVRLRAGLEPRAERSE